MRAASLLVRVYPPRWRARYGAEFETLLEERPLGPFDVADVLLGALDAHLHLRGLGAASEHTKGFTMTLVTLSLNPGFILPEKALPVNVALGASSTE